jgi:23S rRNA (uracil1939-C5)-methyltransferase
MHWFSDPDSSFGYRNKMEYSFTTTDSCKLSLAFFERGRHRKILIPNCRLALTSLNQAARSVCDWLNQHKFPRRSLKSLVLRANEKGEIIAALFIKDVISIIKEPELKAPLSGLAIYFSDPRSPASRPDQLLLEKGETHLTAHVRDTVLTFGLHSFFQINFTAYNAVLRDIQTYLDPARPLVDLYAGVGALSIPLRDHYAACTAVEINEEAVAFARENVRANMIGNYEVFLASTEKALEYIRNDAIILIDPPRSGLHKKVVARLREEKPRRIIYLSCNISTQSRDIAELLDLYSCSFLKIYNFFPHTPHIEALCILDRRE